jgi:Protein of unknown function (DUF2917)
MEHETSLRLETRRLFAIPDAGGVQIRCTAGVLWLTLDHDQRDIILEAGQSFTATDHRRGLLYALEPSSFVLWPLRHCVGVEVGLPALA